MHPLLSCTEVAAAVYLLQWYVAETDMLEQAVCQLHASDINKQNDVVLCRAVLWQLDCAVLGQSEVPVVIKMLLIGRNM